jgi:hypothetical protein
MSTKSRHVIWGGKIMGVEMREQGAREAAQKPIRDADRAEAEAWSLRMKATAGAPNRARPLDNASMVD